MRRYSHGGNARYGEGATRLFERSAGSSAGALC